MMFSSGGSLKQASANLLDVVVVGGGLSGLLVGQGLQRSFCSSSLPTTTTTTSTSAEAAVLRYKILEARSVLGGRLANDANKTDQIDLGGAWIWPQEQPFVRRLVQELKPAIETFSQPDDASSTRIEGGAVQFIREIAKKLPSSDVLLNTPVVSCELVEHANNDKDDITAGRDSDVFPLIRVKTADDQVFYARQVVLAVPPRLLHERVRFDPPLSPEKRAAMASSHTWMAGVTKVALIYRRKFWNRYGSNIGLSPTENRPAFQVYDGSTKDGKIAALTFFTLAQPPTGGGASDSHKRADSALAQQVAHQMAEVWNEFGADDWAKEALEYVDHSVKRWPLEKYISEDSNPATVNPHPTPVRALAETEWDGRLHFSGTESDLNSPGVMEGAVSSARRVLQELEHHLSSTSDKTGNHEQTRVK